MKFNSYREISAKRYREDFGFYYEDFEIGVIIEHRPGRTITQTDNIWMTLLTMNTSPLHFDAHYAKNTEWKRPLVDSTTTFAIVSGMTVNSISKKVVANLGWDKIQLLKPVFDGDTLYAESEIIAKRESKSRPQQGIVTVDTKGFNQNNELVIQFQRTLLVYKKSANINYDI
jgi:itaconyl-CoA hydratase